MTHAYRLFIQEQLDARGWKPAELARRAGLHRQLIWKILNDQREHLGQMPDDATMEGMARAFEIPAEQIRTAAARSLVGYTDDGHSIAADVKNLPTDVLIEELRRRTEMPRVKDGDAGIL